MIRTIEDEGDVRQTASISGPSVDRSQLVALSKRYGVLCGLTSFVAVEHRSLEDRNAGQPALRRVPVMLAAEWGGIAAGAAAVATPPAQVPLAAAGALYDAGARGIDMDSLSDIAPATAAGGLFKNFARRLRTKQKVATPPPAAPPAGAASGIGVTLDKTIDKFKDSLDRSFDKSLDRAASPGPAAPPSSGLINLLTHQMADGSFDSSGAVDHAVRAAGLDPAALLAAMEHLLHDAHVPSAARPKIRQTLLVLLLLTRAFADRKPTWNRAFKKGLRFVTAQGQLRPGVAQAWLDELSVKFG
jgi:hypothetical protein